VAWRDGVTVCTCSCTAEKERLSLAGRGRRAAPGKGRLRGACRGDAVRRPGASVYHGPMVIQRGDRTCAAPAGRPTGSPLQCPLVGFGRSSERTESCRLFRTKQRRNASPWQGEAGAQRRVRVDHGVHVGATRCVALVPASTMATHHPACRPPRPRRATHRVAPTLPAGRAQDRMYHARSRLASRRVRCTRGDARAARRSHPGIRWNMACSRGGSRTAPTTRAAGRPRCSLLQCTRLHTACRGDAVRRPGAIMHDGPASSRVRARHPPGDPPCRPYIARWQDRLGRASGQKTAVCSQRSKKETPLPGQGEAGAQRRVRVDPVVVRPLGVHVVCQPAPCLAAASPSPYPIQHGVW
jgi:hypothetical protein